jgi:hypothetical protein
VRRRIRRQLQKSVFLAKAGTQIQPWLLGISEKARPYDLGPGLRRGDG